MEETKTVLYVDDDPLTRQILIRLLEASGYHVLEADNGPDALRLLREHPVHLLLLDVMMPGMDGYETCRAAREISDVPVVFLTARSGEDDLVTGFKKGAQDYITKPFRHRELLVRIDALLNRNSRMPARHRRVITHKNIVLDQTARVVRKNGKLVTLSPTSYQLLEYFLLHPGMLVTKTDLLRNVWDLRDPVDGVNMVEAAIKRLRREMGESTKAPEYILTVWGQGYRVED